MTTKQSCMFHTDPTLTAAMVWLRTFLKKGQLTWPDGSDLTWPWAKNFTECLQWMSVKSQRVSALYLQSFGKGRGKISGGGGGSLRPSPARNRVNVQLKHEKDGHFTRRINDNWPNCLSNRYRNFTHKQLKWNSLITSGPFVLHFDERRRLIFAIKISFPKTLCVHFTSFWRLGGKAFSSTSLGDVQTNNLTHPSGILYHYGNCLNGYESFFKPKHCPTNATKKFELTSQIYFRRHFTRMRQIISIGIRAPISVWHARNSSTF